MTDDQYIFWLIVLGVVTIIYFLVVSIMREMLFPSNPFSRDGYVSRNSLHHTIWPRHPANYPAKLAVKKYREAFKRHVNDEETHQTPHGGNAK